MWIEVLPPAPALRPDQQVTLRVRLQRATITIGAALASELRIVADQPIQLLWGDDEHADRLRLVPGRGRHSIRKAQRGALRLQTDAWSGLAGRGETSLRLVPRILDHDGSPAIEIELPPLPSPAPSHPVIRLAEPVPEPPAEPAPPEAPIVAEPEPAAPVTTQAEALADNLETLLAQLRARAQGGVVGRAELQVLAVDRDGDFQALRANLTRLRNKGLVELLGAGGKGVRIQGVRLVTLGPALPTGSRAVRGAGPTKPAAKAGKRACLSCGRDFVSSGIGNRMCKPCSHQSGLEG